MNVSKKKKIIKKKHSPKKIKIKKEHRTIVDDYLDYQEKYQKKYGEKTIVLIEVGSFFEIYGVNNSVEKIGLVEEITHLLNIQMTRKNKNISENSRKNALLGGFPNHSLEKFRRVLLENQYTIVLIEQVTPPPKPKRRVTNIYSPGTYIEQSSSFDTNNIMCIYFEEIPKYQSKNSVLTVGLSLLDVTTGENLVLETSSTITNKIHSTLTLDEITRCCSMYRPKEVLVYTHNLTIYTKDELNTLLGLEDIVVHICWNKLPKKFKRPSYQNEILKKAFPYTGLLSVIEFLHLERSLFALISYVGLLQFAYEHNETIIKQLNKPTFWKNNQHLLLSNNSVHQLHVIPTKRKDMSNSTQFKSLFNVINKAHTPFGKRTLLNRLIHPIINKTELVKRYKYVEIFMKEDKSGKLLYSQFEDYLKQIYDIERLQRKIDLQTLSPAAFLNVDMSFDAVLECFEKLQSFSRSQPELEITELYPNSEEFTRFNKFIEEYRDTFDIAEMSKYNLTNITNSFFKKGIFPEIDAISYEYLERKEVFKQLSIWLSQYVQVNRRSKNNDNPVSVNYTDAAGYYLSTTVKRGSVIQKKIKQWIQDRESKGEDDSVIFGKYRVHISQIKFTKMASRCRINSIELRHLSESILGLEKKLGAKVKSTYIEKLTEYSKLYRLIVKKIIQYIGVIDIICSSAKTALLYNYVCPKFENLDIETNSFIVSKAMRHPIIERIQHTIKYVPNDIILGKSITKKSNPQYGILLFGVNAVGKSSLMKSVGLNIILAQAGLFVAADSFIYEPYSFLGTRISGNDNMFKGQSTFAVEMSELRNILKRTGPKSLVLGDELCNGTEAISGLSIVAAGVLELVKKQSSFIFATHLHALDTMKRIKDLDTVNSYHMKVIYDKKNKTLVYDRKLELGSGDPLYGLEVCRAMDLSEEFLKVANEIRKEIMTIPDELVPYKPSHFNKSVYIDTCLVCNSKGEEVHHIQFQCTADQYDRIGPIHKNVKSNLVVLCSQCHQDVHHPTEERGQLIINGYKQTTDGKKLDYHWVKKDKNTTVKSEIFDGIISKKVLDLLAIPKMTAKKARFLLKKEGVILSLKEVKKYSKTC